MGPLKGTRGSPFPQNAAGGETDRKKSLGMGKGLDAEQRGGRAGARKRPEVRQPCHHPGQPQRAMLLSRALPTLKAEGWSRLLLPLNY